MYKTVVAALLAFATLLLGGCATFSADGGFGTVDALVKERTGQSPRWVKTDADADQVRSEVAQILAKPLSADDAVRVALLNNRGLQAGYAELGIAEADLVQAGRLPNPRLSYLRARHGAELKTETLFMLNVFAFLTMPLATEIESRHFEVTKHTVAMHAVEIAARTRQAWARALAAKEAARYFTDVKTAAEASAELARRMAAAGNYSRLQRAREQAFYADAVAQLARAEHAALFERENLSRLMGLWGGDLGFQLPVRLPDLPAAPQKIENLEQRAIDGRLDVQAARLELEGLAKSLGLTRTTRFINAVEFGPARIAETPNAPKKGYEIALEIPLFDWGGARVARAEHQYMQGVNQLAQLAVNARSEVRGAYSAYRTAYDLAKHYRDEIVPLRKRISEENLLRYNGMLISVFELLADAREQVMSVNAYIEALRDFWLADSDLQSALTNGRQLNGERP